MLQFQEQNNQLSISLSQQFAEEESRLKVAKENNGSDIEIDEIQDKIYALRYYWINVAVKH